jgi:hypothetical protein
MIAAFSVAQSSAGSDPATDAAHQSDLQGLLCRIDRRCPAANLATHEASRMQIAEMTAR